MRLWSPGHARAYSISQHDAIGNRQSAVDTIAGSNPWMAHLYEHRGRLFAAISRQLVRPTSWHPFARR